MLRQFSSVLLGVLLVSVAPRTSAFSLLGPPDTWQVPLIGYMIDATDLGAPMNLGEEYRLNLPMLTFGFDESFMNYFGTRGVAEVEKAIQILNDLPPFSQMSADLNEFPLDTRRFNYLASALNLYDLKTDILSGLLEQMGLAAPERYVWTLRNYIPPDAGPIFTVIQRNFDPITFEPSSYVNGSLYTYQILQTYTNPEVWEAVEYEVDPTVPNVSSVAALGGVNAGTIFANGLIPTFSPGMFYTGLTRDDVAGLRYLMRPNNFNTEPIVTNAVAALYGSGNGIVGQGTPNPWLPPPFGTNAATTNTIPTNAVVNVALRGGVDKVTFVRVNYDSLTGSWVPLTNYWTDYYVTNGVRRSQQLQRALAVPDIVFSAADLGVNPNTGVPILTLRTVAFSNQDAINGTETLAGPGVLSPPTRYAVSKLGRSYLLPGGGEANHTSLPWWGSYDGTTNLPALYPVGASIRALENAIMTGRQSGVNPWLAPPNYQTTSGTNQTGGTGGTVGGGLGGGTGP